VVEDEEGDDDGSDDEPIDAEVIDVTPKRCPQCESYDVRRAKSFAVYLAIIVSAFGAAIAVEQGGLAFLAIVLALVVYFVMPPYVCNECGKRFD